MNLHTGNVSGSALLLAPREDLAAVDRRALREAGFRSIRLLSSGVEAAVLLAETAETVPAERPSQEPRFIPDIVLCNEQLADMSGDDFVRLVRLHPRLPDFPIIVTASADSEIVRRRAVETGYSGLLIRPYPQVRLLEELARARNNRNSSRPTTQGGKSGDADAFKEALATYKEAARALARNSSRQFREGLVCLRQHRWDEGIALLQRSLEENPEHGDALLALGAAWRGKGNPTKYRAMLREAVAVFAEQQAWEKARTVAQRLMQENPTLSNPLLEEAGRLLVKSDFDSAAQALLAAREIAPCPDMYDRLFRACTLCPDTSQAIIGLRRALAAADAEDVARQTLAQLASRLEKIIPKTSEQPVFRELAALPPPSVPDMPKSRSAAGRHEEAAAPLILPLEASRPSARPARGKKTLREPPRSIFMRAGPTLRDAWTVAKITAGLFRRLK